MKPHAPSLPRQVETVKPKLSQSCRVRSRSAESSAYGNLHSDGLTVARYLRACASQVLDEHAARGFAYRDGVYLQTEKNERIWVGFCPEGNYSLV
ncbi:unnamed protein product [Protopolystoma xenopodis]|uniref:Uncharacterized protein n=1 Tax=Protopolystoma xenopodis TaxID=117903 RepID=A0A3S5B9T9_9PLAT|nr:unnamed protein product [Protopolystoma xenopodis]